MEARHPKGDLIARAEGDLVLVQPLRWKPEPWHVLSRDDMISFHRDQVASFLRDQPANIMQRSQPFAVAFHLERLYRLEPAAAVRDRLLDWLRWTPDSPAGRTVRQRLLGFDLARQAGAVCSAWGPVPGLPALPALAATAEAVPSLAPRETLPPRMPYAPE